MTNREQAFKRVCSDHGTTPEAIARAAHHLGELRAMTANDIADNLTMLEDEVVRHLQVSQAFTMAYGI